MGNDQSGVYQLEPYIYMYCIEDVCRPVEHGSSYLSRDEIDEPYILQGYLPS